MITLRAEKPEDIDDIRQIITAAFKGAAHSSGTEAAIVDALRTAGALTLSLVALDNSSGEIVGHLAFSPVTIGSGIPGWFGLGPVSVRPNRQGQGIGKQLIESGLAQLRERGASGCVVLGDPHYYIRFGFVSDPALRYADVPPEYFQRIVFKGTPPIGAVAYHPGFDAG
ncbi:putative acetyltransferase [Rhizobium hainanense]|uniref:Putative acetyltransferase n=1 Tax=Rhizobium hainanense TaxID=52131 RepID=A0A1C3U1T1_9HYPH|nr:putative acetyltransferase [Rhizobium hainanense]